MHSNNIIGVLTHRDTYHTPVLLLTQLTGTLLERLCGEYTHINITATGRSVQSGMLAVVIT
jgi:hypothetical protein